MQKISETFHLACQVRTSENRPLAAEKRLQQHTFVGLLFTDLFNKNHDNKYHNCKTTPVLHANLHRHWGSYYMYNNSHRTDYKKNG